MKYEKVRTTIRPNTSCMPVDKYNFLNDWLIEQEQKYGKADPHEYALMVTKWNIEHKSEDEDEPN